MTRPDASSNAIRRAGQCLPVVLAMTTVKVRRVISRRRRSRMHPAPNLAPRTKQPIQHLLTPLGAQYHKCAPVTRPSRRPSRFFRIRGEAVDLARGTKDVLAYVYGPRPWSRFRFTNMVGTGRDRSNFYLELVGGLSQRLVLDCVARLFCPDRVRPLDVLPPLVSKPHVLTEALWQPDVERRVVCPASARCVTKYSSLCLFGQNDRIWHASHGVFPFLFAGINKFCAVSRKERSDGGADSSAYDAEDHTCSSARDAKRNFPLTVAGGGGAEDESSPESDQRADSG